MHEAAVMGMEVLRLEQANSWSKKMIGYGHKDEQLNEDGAFQQRTQMSIVFALERGNKRIERPRNQLGDVKLEEILWNFSALTGNLKMIENADAKTRIPFKHNLSRLNSWKVNCS
ncbi:hypothetical protein ACQ4LE_009026 [Meloidogyne hapla]